MCKVFILILNYNGWRDTIECLESVQRLTYPNYRIVVIDNCSTDGSLEKIKAWAAGELSVESKFFAYDPLTKPVRWIEYDRATAEAGGLPVLEAEIEALPPNRRMVLVQTGANLGFGAGNNVGIRYALWHGADYIWLLNNDTIVDPLALTRMIEKAESDKRIGAVGSVLYYMDEPDRVQAWGGGWVNLWTGLSRYRPGPVPESRLHYVGAASLLIRRAALEEVGLFNETFFMYWEDTDLCFRLRKAGWRLLVAEDSRVWHKESASVGKGSALLDQYSNTSAVGFFRRHAPVPAIPITIGTSARLVKRLLGGHGKRAWAVWVGVVEGLKVKR